MHKWRDARIPALAAAVWLTLGCGMAENKALVQPKPPANAKEIQAGDESRKLDTDVTTLLRGKYGIVSGRYFRVAGDIPWVAVAKAVQNEMAEKSIQRTMLDWYEPGIDFLEIYPQGKAGEAFAVAMPKGARSSAEKVVGYYVLGPGK
jgi:hypothetical protein